MSKTFYYSVFAQLIIAFLCFHTKAQEFRWPREKALEVGGGITGSGFCLHGGYVRYFQPKSIKEIPFKKRFKSLIGRNKYVAFPCKRKPNYKIPPGFSTKISFFYEQGSGKDIQYYIVGVDASMNYLIYTTKYLYISLKGGVTGSNNCLLTPLSEGNTVNFYNRLKYGVFGGGEAERMINKYQSTSIIAGWEQYYLTTNDIWGNKRWYAYIGLRFRI